MSAPGDLRRAGTTLARLVGWSLVLAGALLLLSVALAGCGADPGYGYYDGGSTVIVHQHTSVTHVHVYPRPRAVPPVVRPRVGGRR